MIMFKDFAGNARKKKKKKKKKQAGTQKKVKKLGEKLARGRRVFEYVYWQSDQAGSRTPKILQRRVSDAESLLETLLQA